MSGPLLNRKSGLAPQARGRAALAALGLWLLLCVSFRGAGAEAGGLEGGAALWLGGDVYLGDGGLPEPWLAPALQQALAAAGPSAGIVNLEGPLCAGVGGSAPASAQAPDSALRLCQGPQVPAALFAAGVRVAGIVNNHAADGGPSGAPRTMAALRGAGVLPAGGAAGAALLTLPLGVEGAGRRTPIAGAAPLRVVVSADDLSAGLPPGLAARLREERTRGEVLVVTFHVTGPPSYLPSPLLRQAVELALASGAQVVAAHGSHVVGAVERRGAALIAWGLGNLAFACTCTSEAEGLVLRVRLQRSAAGVQVTGEVLPIAVGLLPSRARGPARLAADAAAIFDLLDALGGGALRRRGFKAEL